MRNPLPNNRLVALTLVGALATAVLASALVVPGVFGTTADDTDGPTQAQATPNASAPQPNENFTAAVSNSANSANRGEEHEDGEHEDGEYGEYEEHE